MKPSLRTLLDSLFALAWSALALAVFGLSAWLSTDSAGRGDWPYAALMAALCLLPGFVLDFFRRGGREREARAAERREADGELRELRENRREERQELDDSHASWVHEFKTPLTALRLILDADDDAGSDTYAEAGSGHDASAFRGKISAEVERLERLLELSLFESRAGSFDRDYVISEIDIRRVCAESAASLAGVFNAAGVGFAMDDFSLSASSDARWLSFVLRQILLNAVKHSPARSCVRIGARTAPNAPEARATPPVPEIFVEDSGAGIPPEDIERIFDRGFTGTAAREAAEIEGRRIPNATGMGLYLSNRLCARLGHALRAENKAEGGCRLVLSFPPATEHLDPATRLTKT